MIFESLWYKVMLYMYNKYSKGIFNYTIKVVL